MMLLDAIEAGHEGLRAAGWRLLQPYRFAASDEGHVGLLLDLADIPNGARVLDVGCGVGECARLMYQARPDLDIVLLNFSAAQLADCPPQFEQHLADAHALPFANESFDCVMFHAALGNMDLRKAVAEASRVLRPGGKLLVNEVQRLTGDGEAMQRLLMYRAIVSQELFAAAETFDLSLEFSGSPTIVRHYLRDVWPAETPGTYEEAFAGCMPRVWLFQRRATDIARRLSSYRRPALHFSGGKDSLALLYRFREHLGALTVYWLNTGDGCPETRQIVDSVRSWVPNFVEVRSDVITWRQRNGYPTDLVPAKAHPIGVMYGLNDFSMTNRFDCCAANIMLPMHQRMVADGVDLVIRGTKACDTGRVPVEGPTGAYDVWLPIRDWTHERVFDFLREVGAPENPIYEHFAGISAPECIGCTAWWDDGKAAYLQARHPHLLDQYRANLKLIRGTLQSHLSDLAREIGD